MVQKMFGLSIWKMLRGLMKTSNESVETKTTNKERWKEYFNQLHDNTKKELHEEDEEYENRKIPNQDRICHKFYKYGAG